MSEDDTKTQHIAASTFKLAQFWTVSPTDWFLLAEIQFEAAKIVADKTKYQHVIAALDPTTFGKVRHFLRNPPATDQYSALKAEMLARLAPSSERQLEALLTGEDLGDRQPSEALRHIQTLAEKRFPDDTVKSLWLRKLPEVIKVSLLSQPATTSLDELAITADKIHDALAMHRVHAVDRVSQPESRPRTNTFRDYSGRDNTGPQPTMQEQLAKLQRDMERLTFNARETRASPRSRSLSRNRRNWRGPNRNQYQHSPSPNRQASSHNWRSDDRICHFHRKFGKKAYMCRQPCSFDRNTQYVNPKNE